MQPDNLRAAFATPSSRGATGWTVKRALSWVARGGTALVLILCGVVWLEGRQLQGKIDSLATEVVASVGDTPSPEESDKAFAELDQQIAEINRKTDEARALATLATGEISTVAEWRDATRTAQVVRAEYWLRAAVGDKGKGISDATFRMYGADIADCVNTSIRAAAGVDDLPAVEFGARCIARLAG